MEILTQREHIDDETPQRGRAALQAAPPFRASANSQIVRC